MFNDLQDNKFDGMRPAIALDKVGLVCAETVKAKPTGNNSGYTTYANTISYYGIWLDNSGYLTSLQKNV